MLSGNGSEYTFASSLSHQAFLCDYFYLIAKYNSAGEMKAARVAANGAPVYQQ